LRKNKILSFYLFKLKKSLFSTFKITGLHQLINTLITNNFFFIDFKNLANQKRDTKNVFFDFNFCTKIWKFHGKGNFFCKTIEI
jgi:hypothetical protein